MIVNSRNKKVKNGKKSKDAKKNIKIRETFS